MTTFAELKAGSAVNNQKPEKEVDPFDKQMFNDKLKEMYQNLKDLEAMFSRTRACYKGITLKNINMISDIAERMEDIVCDLNSEKG
jgi:hypothetical protein